MARKKSAGAGAGNSAPPKPPGQASAKGSVFVVVKAHDGFEQGREIAKPNPSIAKRMVQLGYWEAK